MVMRDIFQNNIPNEGMLFIVLFTQKQEAISSSQYAVGGKKNISSSAPRSADFQSHLQAKLLNSAPRHNKLHQFLHNSYKKLQLWLVQRGWGGGWGGKKKELSGKAFHSPWLLLFIHC